MRASAPSSLEAGTPWARGAAVHLRLGRVSNLPTVWSNVVAGAALGGGSLGWRGLGITACAMSLFYVGGMYLNDAFDRRIDALERPERPIPSGAISASRAFSIGFGMLAIGLALLAADAVWGHGHWSAVAAGAGLGAAVVLYDSWHKQNPLSPVVMGLCRVLVYVVAALATGGTLGVALLAGCAALLGYLIGLTYVAKQENRARFHRYWPLVMLAAPLVIAFAGGTIGVLALALAVVATAWVVRAVVLVRAGGKAIPGAVASLIAGLALVDALLLASQGYLAVALVAAVAFPATLLLHRWVAGT